jgi:hypothetical protein
MTQKININEKTAPITWDLLNTYVYLHNSDRITKHSNESKIVIEIALS